MAILLPTMGESFNLDNLPELMARCDGQSSMLFDEENKPQLQLLRAAGSTGFSDTVTSTSYPQLENVISASELKKLNLVRVPLSIMIHDLVGY